MEEQQEKQQKQIEEQIEEEIEQQKEELQRQQEKRRKQEQQQMHQRMKNIKSRMHTQLSHDQQMHQQQSELIRQQMEQQLQYKKQKEQLEERMRRQEKHLQEQQRQRERLKKPVWNTGILSDEEHDNLVLYKLSNDDEIKRKIYQHLPIFIIIKSMGSFVALKYKKNIKEFEEKNGSYAATKLLFTLGIVRKLKSGWTRQLIQIIIKLELKDIEELISPNKEDYEDFIARIGIPRNSLLERISEQLGNHCAILISPMGKKDGVEESENVPVVYPQLCISENHFSIDTTFTDGKYQPMKKMKQMYEDSPRISFYDIIRSTAREEGKKLTNKYSSLLWKQHNISMFLIGPAGSGKTTTVKRIVKTCNKSKMMAFLIPLAQIDKQDRWSVRDLLTKFISRSYNLEHDPSEEEVDETFSWVNINQDKCWLIFDGLDQAGFSISTPSIEESDINAEYSPNELLALILSRRFLPGVRLILSSRPHSIAKLPAAIQPQIVVFLNDLLPNDAEKLMDHYLEQGVASKILEELRTKSPRIHSLVFNPLFLRLVVMLNNEVGADVWTYVNTTAKLFFEIIDRLQLSSHHECGLGVDDVEVLNIKLAAMAFFKTMEGSVVFEQTDLERYGLSGENIQDFLFGVMSSKHNTALLVVLMVVFYFNHQSTQEFFSARYALEKLPVDEFDELVRIKLFPTVVHEYGDVYIGEDSFNNIRTFIIGCINEHKSRQLDDADIMMKKNIFIDFLCDHIRHIFVPSPNEEVEKHQKQIFVDFMDFREDHVISEICENLKDFSFTFNYSSILLHISAHRESFFHFLRHFVSKVENLEIEITEWNDDQIGKFFQAIQSSKAKIVMLKLRMDSSSHRYVSDITSLLLTHLTHKLQIEFLPHGGDIERIFCRKFEQEINNCATSSFQSRTLEVKIWRGYANLLLHIILHHGKPPQFITSR